MGYKEIKTLKGQVEHCLREHPSTRNSDILLMTILWREFYPTQIVEVYGVAHISLSALYVLPREDNIKRVRAQFQNDKGLYLPTDWKVAQKRGIAEDEWRVALGFPTKETTGTDQPSWTPPSEQGECSHLADRFYTDEKGNMRCGVCEPVNKPLF